MESCETDKSLQQMRTTAQRREAMPEHVIQRNQQINGVRHTSSHKEKVIAASRDQKHAEQMQSSNKNQEHNDTHLNELR